MDRARWLAGLALLLLIAAPAFPQGLGEAAAKEREKRARAGEGDKSVPSFTNDDLQSEKEWKKRVEEAKARGEKPPPRPVPKSTTSSGGSTGVDESAEGGEAQAGEAQWRQRAKGARERIAAAESREASAQARVGQLKARLNPMSPSYEQDPNQILVIQKEVTAAEAVVAAAHQELEAARRALEELAEEARRASVPPGWVRP